MAKVFGILLILIGIWVGLTIYTEGAENAFGGLLAGVHRNGANAETAGSDTAPPDRRPPTERIRDRVTSAFQAHEERTERMIGEQ